jgi:nucleotide-binding universal stress UspA family protein
MESLFFQALVATLAVFSILIASRASASMRDPPTGLRVRRPNSRSGPLPRQGSVPKLRLLVPVLDSVNSAPAVRHVIGEFMRGERVEVHLLHVGTPLSRHVARWMPARNCAGPRREAAEKALRAARDLLDAFHIRYTVHIEVGDRAAVISTMARQLDVDRIVLGVARDNTLTRFIEDAVVERVTASGPVPVDVVAGKSVSRLERFGVPIGLGAALGLLSIRLGD